MLSLSFRSHISKQYIIINIQLMLLMYIKFMFRWQHGGFDCMVIYAGGGYVFDISGN
jgi:hypothetical protein